MANQGNARGAPPARENSYAQDDDLQWEEPVHGQGGQGDGGEGSDLSAGAADDAEFEQDGGQQDGEGLEEEVAFEPQRPQRAQNRIQTLARENADLRRRLTDVERRTREISPPAAAPVTPPPAAFGLTETDEQFRARIANLSWEEQWDAKQERADKKAEVRQRMSDFAQQQNLDKANWDALCAKDPLREEWSYEVEKKREELIANGQYVNRDVIFKFMYGEHMASPDGRKGRQQRRAAAQQRVASQTVRPSSPRSDAAAGNRRAPRDEREARARRLDGVQL